SRLFFQAEGGIRDFHVTGVQTCALPISYPCSPRRRTPSPTPTGRSCPPPRSRTTHGRRPARAGASGGGAARLPPGRVPVVAGGRSEERRVGKGSATEARAVGADSVGHAG